MIPHAHNGEKEHSEIKPLIFREPVKHERLYYLDWLRVLAVCGVFVAHTADIFDTLYWHTRQGGGGGITWDALGTSGAEWGMSLVFLLAGAGTWFALSFRTGNQFIIERFTRLLIPFIVAFILLSPFQAYIMAYFIASGYSHFHGDLAQFFPYFFEHIRVGSDLRWLTIYGYHLWFLAFLYIISMMALPICMYLKQERGSQIIERLAALCNTRVGLFIFVLPISLVRIMLWAPFPGYQNWSDFFSWLLIFVLGFILFANARFQAAVRKQGKIFLPITAICMLVLIVTNIVGILSFWENAPGYSAAYLLYQILLSISIWSATVSALYVAMRFLNFSNKALRYANEAILPFYVIHEPVIVIIAFYVLAWDLPTGVKYLFVSMAALIVTLLLYELVIRRIKPMRWLFGMKPSQPRQPALITQS
jgi:peptidoglycan/LPS O-acetylase OafA/YrhL